MSHVQDLVERHQRDGRATIVVNDEAHGAVVGAHFQAFVRIFPPPLVLAFAMTEPEEKAERLRIMPHRHCTELEAAYAIAERLAEGGA